MKRFVISALVAVPLLLALTGCVDAATAQGFITQRVGWLTGEIASWALYAPGIIDQVLGLLPAGP